MQSDKNKVNIHNNLVDGPGQKFLKKLKIDSKEKKYLLKKTIFLIILSWLPLLILSIFQSIAINPQLKIPFLLDFVVYTRVFIALPLLLLAERLINFVTDKSLNHFTESGLVEENHASWLDKNLKRFGKLRDSGMINVIIILITYSTIIFGTRNFWKYDTQGSSPLSWHFLTGTTGQSSLSSYWYELVTIPVCLFLSYKLLWLFILWTVLLFKVSRMNLSLISTHPDLAGGISFLGHTQVFFGAIGLVQNVIISAETANNVIYKGAVLADYKYTIIGIILLETVVFVAPMFLFLRKLAVSRFIGMLDYDIISHKYVYDFHDKWIKGNNPDGEQLLGTSDIQSLADISNSYKNITTMKAIPIRFHQVFGLILILALPFLPLLLLEFPISEIFRVLVHYLI